jgi:hypothetical protein
MSLESRVDVRAKENLKKKMTMLRQQQQTSMTYCAASRRCRPDPTHPTAPPWSGRAARKKKQRLHGSCAASGGGRPMRSCGSSSLDLCLHDDHDKFKDRSLGGSNGRMQFVCEDDVESGQPTSEERAECCDVNCRIERNPKCFATSSLTSIRPVSHRVNALCPAWYGISPMRA